MGKLFEKGMLRQPKILCGDWRILCAHLGRLQADTPGGRSYSKFRMRTSWVMLQSYRLVGFLNM
jgi:hypothetical protein